MYERTDVKEDKKLLKKLIEPLKIGKKVLALAERLKKKDAEVLYTRAQPRTCHFFVKISNTNYHCWISKEGDGKVIDKRFLRQELFALNNQFD